ncbi:hypothetical protein RSAG8_11767, partial [Rhizoctonia solani AG-8 WAC10335]
MPPHTSAADKAEIVAMVDHAKMSFAEVAGKVHRDATTVSRIYNRYHITRDFDVVAPRSGRPRKMTESDANFAVLEINQGSPITASS